MKARAPESRESGHIIYELKRRHEWVAVILAVPKNMEITYKIRLPSEMARWAPLEWHQFPAQGLTCRDGSNQPLGVAITEITAIVCALPVRLQLLVRKHLVSAS